MWTVRVGKYEDGWNRFHPRRVVFRSPRYVECVRFVRAYGVYDADYEIIHIVGCPARFDKHVHVMTGKALRNGGGAFVMG